jgi:hypothetical protein
MADGEIVEGIPIGGCTGGGCKVRGVVLFVSGMRWKSGRFGKYHDYPGIWRKFGFFAS